jgi:hypothetical protein
LLEETGLDWLGRKPQKTHGKLVLWSNCLPVLLLVVIGEPNKPQNIHDNGGVERGFVGQEL